MYKYQPKEIELRGFYEIPGYKLYGLSRDGRVFNRESSSFLSGSLNPAGYKNFRLKDDTGYTMTWGIHRLLLFVFKRHSLRITNLVGNHIDGVKSNNSLENLEWTTYRENAEHAGMHGLTTKCQPISTRDVKTGIIENFPSIAACARKYGVTKDTINYRVKSGEDKIFPDNRRYRNSQSTEPWPQDSDKLNTGTAKGILVRDVITKTVTEFNKISDFAEYIKVPQSTISLWLNNTSQPVLPGLIQIKLKSDNAEWRHIENPLLELEEYTKKKCVVVINDSTLEERYFTSAIECAKEFNLSATCLNFRLKFKGERVWKDGFRYLYYTDFIASKWSDYSVTSS